MIIMGRHCTVVAARVNRPPIVGPMVAQLRKAGMSQRQIVAELDLRVYILRATVCHSVAASA